MKDERIYLLNAVWYKPDGEKKYLEYLSKATALIEKVGGRRLKRFVPERVLVGDFDADLVFIVEAPSWKAYKEFATSGEHHKLAYLRAESTEKVLQVRCRRP